MPPTRRASTVSFSTSRRNSSFKGYAFGFDENEIVPTSPSLELMDVIPGYENVSFEPATISPPRNYKTSNTNGNTRKAVVTPCPVLSEDQVRAALILHVSKHHCYGRDAAKGLKIVSIQSSSAFHYQLQTYTERRETSWAFTPYSSNSDVDTAEGGPVPLPWDIPVSPTKLFEMEVKSLSVPHTSSVKHCFRCNGSRNTPCHECYGKGWVRCLHCNGDGFSADYNYQERCFFCRSSTHGFGRLDCLQCNATGKLNCQTCEGSGLMVYFIQLTVTWKTNSSEHILTNVSLPETLVKFVSGEEVFSEEGISLYPIQEFPEETIKHASTQLLQKHETQFTDQRILAQRQQVRVVHITCITYEWKDKEGQFFVYGKENKVYAPDYPQTCCCTCNII